VSLAIFFGKINRAGVVELVDAPGSKIDLVDFCNMASGLSF
jgi:hypothetical protein